MIKYSLTAVSLIFFSACVAPQWQEPNPSIHKNLANLTFNPKYGVSITSIDGHEIKSENKSIFKLMPGFHLIKVNLKIEIDKVNYYGEMTLSFEAKAEEEYYLTFKDDWNFKKWSAQIKNLRTGHIVSRPFEITLRPKSPFD